MRTKCHVFLMDSCYHSSRTRSGICSFKIVKSDAENVKTNTMKTTDDIKLFGTAKAKCYGNISQF